MRKPRTIVPYANTALLLEWQQMILPEIVASVHRYHVAISQLAGVVECVPGYASLLIRLAENTDAYTVRESIYALELSEASSKPGHLHRLPVTYGGQHGPDLTDVARRLSLTENRVIELHTQTQYLVYLLGFLPGFGFLGATDERLEIPRHHTPRQRVPKGSVGLAGRQTGVYPGESPGGWQLIGRCPLPMLGTGGDLMRLRPGDRVSFYPVTANKFAELTKNPPPWPLR